MFFFGQDDEDFLSIVKKKQLLFLGKPLRNNKRMGGRTGLATICGGSTIRRNLPTISWLGAEKTFVISFIVIIYSDEQVLETPHEALRERRERCSRTGRGFSWWRCSVFRCGWNWENREEGRKRKRVPIYTVSLSWHHFQKEWLEYRTIADCTWENAQSISILPPSSGRGSLLRMWAGLKRLPSLWAQWWDRYRS